MRVFTWEDIVTGKVPKLENFPLVAEYIKESLKACAGIHGAVLCGSFLGGKHSLASDIDCFLVYDRRDVDLVMETLNRVSQFADSFSVPIEFITVNDEFAVTPFNSIGPLFRGHIEWAVRNSGVIKGDPLSMLGKNERDIVDDLVQYLTYRISWLEKNIAKYSTLSPEKQARVLSKVLDPYHVARKIVQTMSSDMGHGLKESLIESYERSIESKYLKNFFMLLHKEAVAYSEMLEYFVQNPSYSQYHRFLMKLEALMPSALAYLHESAHYVLSHPRFGLSGMNYPVFSD